MSMQPPLHGRVAELSAIGTLIETAGRGHSSILVIDGCAGIGKTRLLSAAAALAAAAGMRTAPGRAEADSRTVPMMALLAALFSGPQPLLDRARLRDLPSPPEQRFWLIQELASLLEEAALAGPLLVAVDDVHWADPGTLAALRILPEQLADLPIAWLVARRTEEAGADLAAVLSRLEVLGSRHLTLGPLDRGAVMDIMTDVLGGHPDPKMVQLAASAGGNPLLLAELLSGLLSEGRVRFNDGRAHLLGAGLPGRLGQSMRARLGRLSRTARDAAGVAAVLGRHFTHDQLAAMLNASAAALLGPVEELLRAGLIVEEGEHLAFGHGLVRECVLRALPTSSQRALQRHAVDLFLAEGTPPVEMARQLAGTAAPGDRAAVRLLARAAEALSLADPSAAAELALKALELADPRDDMRGTLTAQAAITLLAAGRPAEGLALAQGALAALPGAEQQAELCLAIAELTPVPADTREQTCRSALGLPGVPPTLRLRLQARLAYSLAQMGDAAQAHETLSAIADDAVTDQAAGWTLQVTRRSLDLMEDRYDDALEGSRQLRSTASYKKPLCAIDIDYKIIEALALRDDLDEALRTSGACVAASARDGQIWAVCTYERQRGRLWAAAGRLPDASAALERAFAGLEPGQVTHTGDAAALGALGRVALRTGSSELWATCERAAREAARVLPPEPRRHAVWLLAVQRMATGDVDAAHALLTDGRIGREPVLPTYLIDPADPVDLVRIALACDDPDLADEAVAVAERRSGRNPGVASLAAIAAHARGLRSGDIAELSLAVSGLAASPRRPALASATEDLGRLLVSDGQTADGAARLGEALTLYAQTGATWDATRARARLRRLGIRRNLQPARPAGNWANLTDSELAVVRLVSTGHTNREIAARLYLSPYTVNTHLRHVFTKLGIRSRTDLVRLYLSSPCAESAGLPGSL